uniref:Uncharacterized protein n=1 Tax=Spermophilus dauricus TaxID=99837 RepID=A0A8C9PPJ2_SPEDA
MQDEPYQVCGLRWGGGVCEGSRALGETPSRWRWGVAPRGQRGGTCWGGRGAPGNGPRGWTPWCRTWLKSCSWKTRPASRWRWGCWCATTQTSGGSTWRPSSTCADCTTLRRARRSWPWPGTWNSVRGEPCRPLGIVPSSRTSLCPALLSASASPSPWAASPCPGWPGPAWPVCPCGLGLCPRRGPAPSAEALPALGLSAPHFAAETPSPCATRCPAHRALGWEEPVRSPPPAPNSPTEGKQRPEGAKALPRPRSALPELPSPTALCKGGVLEGSTKISQPPLPLTSRSGPHPTY